MTKIKTLKCALAAIVALASTGSAWADPFNFTAACLNVDGLPQRIIGIPINTDGPGSDGSKAISQGIAAKGWDFIGFSEDFNYHDEVTSALTDTYYIGTHRAEINLTTLGGTADTDGLCFLSKKIYPDPMASEYWEAWTDKVGDLSHGADEKIKKGFRYYLMDFGNGYKVDVYILHMNSEASDEAIAAKHKQINQLVAHIIATDNKRPIIIMGDTNCRYTREKLKELLIDQINADDRFLIQDPWVELVRSNIYPIYGGESIMVGTYGNQKGEVVDKLFYINNRDSGVKLTANRYFHDDTFLKEDGTPLSDHFPVTVDFTIDEYTYDTTQPLKPEEVAPGAFDGQTFYIYNEATGKYLNQGLNWNTRAMVDVIGSPIEFVNASGNYSLKSLCGVIGLDGSIYMDKADGTWTLAKSGNAYTISFLDNNLPLVIVNESTGLVDIATPTNPDLATWKLISPDDRKAQLAHATPISPIDATFMISGSQFNRNDKTLDNAWIKSSIGSNLTVSYEAVTSGADNDDQLLKLYNDDKGWALSWNSAGTITNTVTNLPAGKYQFSCNAITSTPNVTLSLNGSNLPITKGDSYASLTAEAARNAFNDGSYKVETELVISDAGTLEIKIEKSSNSSQTTSYFDNFRLVYLGPEDISLDDLRDAYNQLKAEASEIATQKMNSTTKADLKNAMVDANTLTTADAIIEASNTLREKMDAANASVANYRTSRVAIDNMYDLLASSNVFKQTQYDTYKDLADDYYAQYNAGTLADVVADPYIATGWHADAACSRLLDSTFGLNNFDAALYVNTWSSEGYSDGSNFKVPFYEYFRGEGDKAGLNAATWSTTASGLVAGRQYTVTVLARVVTHNGAADATPYGISMNVNDANPVNICDGAKIGDTHRYLGRFATIGTADDNGNLTINFSIASDNNIHWLAFKELRVLEPNEMMVFDAASEVPNVVYQDGATYKSSNIVLTDAETYANDIEIEAENVTYTRTFGHANWQAYCLPVDVSLSEIEDKLAKEGETVQVLKFVDVTTDASTGKPTAIFATLDEEASPVLKANVPYLLKPSQTGTITFNLGKKTVYPAEVEYVGDNDWVLISNYEPVTTLYEENSYVVSNGQFYRVKEGVVLNPFRVRLMPISSAASSQSMSIRTKNDVEDTNGINDVITDCEEGVFYDLQGRPVASPRAGVYILNGLKVIIK